MEDLEKLQKELDEKNWLESEIAHQDLSGMRFGKLIVVEFGFFDFPKNSKSRLAYWHCKCDCGKDCYVYSSNLKLGKTKSCGCLQKSIASKTHKKYYFNIPKRLYHIWTDIKARCYNKKESSYKYYGGRGIKMCDEWKNDFISFYKWSVNNGFNENLSAKKCSIDRIDTNGNYEPNNCRWVDVLTQANNKRNNIVIEYNGERYTMKQFCKEFDIPYKTFVSYKSNKNRTIEDAINYYLGDKYGRKRIKRTSKTTR